MSPIATYAASFAEGLWLKIISVTDAFVANCWPIQHINGAGIETCLAHCKYDFLPLINFTCLASQIRNKM
jgi:hypothetical protein